ncbi:MAG TPA: SDR family NAD(P)-dependent oxidoreductase [Salinimicrobium sp.]|nr:SDR family NAD(P)-dependent oxidoreductase [Salinimicrobium sp.]
MKLVSKIAIVTGASRGLGLAIAKALVLKNVKVYGISRNQKDLLNLKKQLGSLFIPVEMNITDQKKISEWIKEEFSEENAPDILINNAGTGQFAKIDELSMEKWHQMIQTNLSAVFYLTSAVTPFMKSKKGSCHIINIGSILGKTSGSEKSAYSATKYAIQGFSEALFKELRGFDIKVSCINPGSIETSFFEESGIEANERMLKPDDVAATIVHVLETPDNVLIDELTLRPLKP